jgi:SAM-dependent methyltransferase
MVKVDWVEGEAQELPFDDASFDRVISTFGHMFATDHRRTGAEMRRVCRPGGTIAVACWTPEGSIGRMFRVLAELVPPPPAGEPPILWGTEPHIRELLGDGRFECHDVDWKDESVESYARFMLDSFGRS